MNIHIFPFKNKVCRNISLIFNSTIVSFVNVRSFISYFARILDCLDHVLTLCLKNEMRLMGRECLYGRIDHFSVANKDWFVINQRAANYYTTHRYVFLWEVCTYISTILGTFSMQSPLQKKKQLKKKKKKRIDHGQSSNLS